MRKLAEESEEGELCCCSVGEEQRKGKGGFEKFKSFLFVCGEEEKKMVWAVGEGSPLCLVLISMSLFSSFSFSS